MRHFTAYIDESGDEGFVWRADGQGASPWFVMAAIVVDAAVDSAAAAVVVSTKRRLGLPEGHVLHWADRRGHPERKVIVQELAMAPVQVICVGVDKRRLAQTVRLRESPALYLYTTRFLLERVSWLVGDAGGRVDCVFENRSSLSYETLGEYIRGLVLDQRYQIRPVIDSIKPQNKDQSKLLQMADACAGAAFAALRPDRFGNVEPAYLKEIGHLLYRRNGNLFSYGLKLFPVGGYQLAAEDPYRWLRHI